MSNMKSVLITGASTGIGRASALRLDSEGFQVFAGVRKPGDGDVLKKASTGGLIPVMLDVTDAKSIATLVKTVSEETNGGLFGLMNNAGLTGGGPVEMVPISKIRSVIEVNLISIFAVTQAFLPLLRKSKGRIINTGSVLGLIAPPGRSIYSATKFALEAISESLRLELKPFGITVSVIEPGAIATEIWRKGSASTDEIIEQSQPDIYELYEPLLKFYKKKFAEQKYLAPEAVADCVSHAFTARKPKRHYVVGNDAKFMLWIKRLPESIRDWFVYKTIYK
jgi:NAD(P)-dependent dehydrogenase (short-subunit alcohol dehydrogenase family)